MNWLNPLYESVFIAPGKPSYDKSKGEICLTDNKIHVYISLTSLQPKLSTIGIIISDLTEKKKNEKLIFEYQKDLESKNNQLLGTNAELASFSYVASHDLQEPLRKIQTFCSRILEKEYANMSESGKSNFSRMQIYSSIHAPDLMKELGKGGREFKDGVNEVTARCSRNNR